MAPRTILYTGKGGVGKTSVAAATAKRLAGDGLECVVVSTDPAHSLSDSLETELGPEPTPIGPGLWGQEVHARREMERHWGSVRRWLRELMAGQGVGDVAAEELTVPPGMDELFSLLQIKRHHDEGNFDVIVVDCAPTGETLRLLGFPEIARWWIDRFFPSQASLMSAARPLARSLLDIELPGGEVLDEIRGLSERLIAMNEILRDRSATSIRLVMSPDEMVVREARRTFTYLSLYGYLTDAVIVNRVFPDEVGGGYFEQWLQRQRSILAEVEEGFAPVPVLTARFFEREMLGHEMLERLAGELFEERSPHELMHSEVAHELIADASGARLRLSVPFLDREDVSLKKIGDELVITAGRERRTVILPQHLAFHRPAGARLEDGRLEVSFEPEDANDRDGSRSTDDGASRGRARSSASRGDAGKGPGDGP